MDKERTGSRLPTRRSPAERVLLELCRALELEHGGRHRWATVSALHKRLPTLTSAQLDAAIAVAADRGWLQSEGKPPHSVLLLAAGRAAIND